MQLVGLIGYPLKHSISPAFQQAAFDQLGLEVRYEAWETEPKEVGKVAEMLRKSEYLGMNVTVPHKETVMQFLDSLDILAKQIGAVNTVVKIGDKLKGFNTDAIGFIKALEKEGQFHPAGKKVVILGAGGASRAVSFSLMQAGVSSLTIANRNIYRARDLVADLKAVSESDNMKGKEQTIQPATLPGKEFIARIQECDLIVNCTSVGMSHSVGEGLSPIDGDLIPPGIMVYDLVYTPAETPLLKTAKSRGAKTLGGMPMLVYQGAAAFELWTDKKAPVDIMMAAARKALAEQNR